MTTKSKKKPLNEEARRSLKEQARKKAVDAEARFGALGLILSEQSLEYLHQLVRLGIYGLSPEDVAARLIDKELQRIIELKTVL